MPSRGRPRGSASYESTAEPIKLGYLFDFKLPDGYPEESRQDLVLPSSSCSNRDSSGDDRPSRPDHLPRGGRATQGVGESRHRRLRRTGGRGLPGRVRSGHHGQLRADTRAIENRFHVPAISVTGSEEWLGEWTFSLSMGSMTDEPIFWADLLAQDGHTEVGALIEASLVGESYIRNFRTAAAPKGIRVVDRGADPTDRPGHHRTGSCVAAEQGDRIRALRIRIRSAQREPGAERARLGPAPPCGTAFQNAWIHQIMWDAILGWTGLDQYDESNPVGQQFLDEYQEAYGRRPEYCVPVVNRDLATVLLHAFADAHPLSPRGVKEALERVEMLPAASGASGTRLSFGNWMRRGWVGAGYLVARQLEPEFGKAHLVGRFGDSEP